ncbi:hypothetical protein [Metabacillus litoralis]|nr:hypothetical protein [Metabacillus litoralis]
MENNEKNIKKEIKHISYNKIIQINIKDSNDNIYAVVTPVNNMNYF